MGCCLFYCVLPVVVYVTKSTLFLPRKKVKKGEAILIKIRLYIRRV